MKRNKIVNNIENIINDFNGVDNRYHIYKDIGLYFSIIDPLYFAHELHISIITNKINEITWHFSSNLTNFQIKYELSSVSIVCDDEKGVLQAVRCHLYYCMNKFSTSSIKGFGEYAKLYQPTSILLNNLQDEKRNTVACLVDRLKKLDFDKLITADDLELFLIKRVYGKEWKVIPVK